MIALALSYLDSSAILQKAEETAVFPVVRKFGEMPDPSISKFSFLGVTIHFGNSTPESENPLLRVLKKPMALEAEPNGNRILMEPFEWAIPYKVIPGKANQFFWNLGESVYKIAEENGIRRILISPEFDSIFNDLNFRSSGYQFDLAGQIVGSSIPIFSMTRRRGVLEFYRGYWKHYFDGDIFWGIGARVRYRNVGYRFFNSDRLAQYDVTSDLAKSWQLGYGRNHIVVETFGLKEPFASLGKIRTHTSSSAIVELYRRFDDIIKTHFGQDIQQVEPIFIRLDPKPASEYRNIKVAPYILPKANP